MRVIAGYLKGRHFDSPAKGGAIHPMSEKARGALFNKLGDISGLTLLDGFAGSGALSIEAVSRSADYVLAVDSSKRSADIIRKNIDLLGVSNKIRFVKANVSSWSENNPSTKFDLVVCDPPYDNLRVGLIQKLVRHVAEGSGIMVLSWPSSLKPPELVGLNLLEQKLYGDMQLVFYGQKD